MLTQNVRKKILGICIYALVYGLCLFLSGLFVLHTAHAATAIPFSGNTSQDLQTVVNSASPGDIIEITDDITFTSTVTIPAGKDITIRSESGNQWALVKSNSSSGRHFTVNGTLTLTNIVLDGDRENNSKASGGVNVNSTGVLYLNDGAVIENCSSITASEGGGITAVGTVIVNGGVIRNNTKNMTNGGGGVQLPSSTSGSFTMNYGTISDNTANTSNSYAGGIVAFGSGTININGGKIYGNTSGTTGGGITVSGSVTLNMTGGEIYGNTAATNGGGLYVAQTASINITGGKIYGNTAAANGGGIYLTSTAVGKAFSVNNCEIRGNAASVGGGIYLNSTASVPASIFIGNCTISGNTAGTGNKGATGSAGGGIYGNLGSAVTFSGGKISNNGQQMTVNGASFGPTSNGGGIYLNSGNGTNVSSVTIEAGSVISNNSARLNGGGVYGYTGSTINVSESAIIGNTAGGNGGGIYSNDVKNLKTTSVTFSGNGASVGYRWVLGEAADNSLAVTYSDTHLANIINTVYTAPFSNVYNNYDVNFSHIQGVTTPCYIVIFDYNYEPSTPVIMAFETGSHITGQPHLDRPGYTFGGWYKDKACTVSWDFATETIASDVTLYAKWSQTGALFIYVTTYAYEELPAGSGNWEEIDTSVYDPGESSIGVLPGAAYTGEAPQIEGYALIIPQRPETINYIEAVDESQNSLRFYYRREESGIGPGVPPVVPSEEPSEAPSEEPSGTPSGEPSVVPSEEPPEVPPGYENGPQEDGSYEVEDSNDNPIGNWDTDENGDWGYNGYDPVPPDSSQLAPQGDGSYEVVSPDGTPDGLWSKNEDDDWVYEEYTPWKVVWPWLLALLALLGLLGVIYFFIVARRHISRERFVQMVVQAIKLETEIGSTVPYDDVTDDMDCYEPIMKAKKEGLLSRFTDSEFKPDAAITREDMASILAEAIRYANIPITVEPLAPNTSPRAYKDINELLLVDIGLVLQLKIMHRKFGGKFDPRGLCHINQAKKTIKNLLAVISAN